MSPWRVDYSRNAEKFLDKLDSPQRHFILEWVNRNLQGCSEPRAYGETLHGNLRQYWKYRVGNYRLLADLQDDKVIIYIVQIADRKDVYRKQKHRR